MTLRLRFGDYARATRSHTLSEPTAATKTVLATTRSLLAAASGTIERRGLTLIGVTVANLDQREPRQLALALERSEGAALDAVRDRFGAEALTPATLIGRARAAAWLFPGEDPDP